MISKPNYYSNNLKKEGEYYYRSYYKYFYIVNY